jgi:hypothetical protein
MIRVLRRSAALASTLLLLGGCSSAAPTGAAGFPATPLVTTNSASGALRVQVRTSPQPLARGSNDVQLTVMEASSGAARDDLMVSVKPWMPSMNHGSSTVPTVTAQGEGKYLVTGVNLFMPGRWELRMSLSGSSPDEVVVASDIP